MKKHRGVVKKQKVKKSNAKKVFPCSNDSMQKTKQKNCKAWTAISQVVNVVSLETKTAAKVKKEKKSRPEEKEGRRQEVSLSQETNPSFWTNMH